MEVNYPKKLIKSLDIQQYDMDRLVEKKDFSF